MAEMHVHFDHSLSLATQLGKGHNRWHPDIMPAIKIATGSQIALATLVSLGGLITPRTAREDLTAINMGCIHPLTGPVQVAGAEPGDLLAIRIEEFLPADRGFTVMMPSFGCESAQLLTRNRL